MSIIKRANIVVYTTGSLVSFIALAVLVSWFVEWRAVFQIRHDFVPIAFNTALCHLMCGICLLTLYKFKKLSLLLAGAIAAFSFTIGLQYFLGVNFGIDKFFVDPSIITRSSYPGRMAPNTVLYFLLSAIGFMSWHFKKYETRLMSLMLIGMVLLLLSILVLTGYIVKVEAAYSWWGMSDMAPLTAVEFFIISLGILGLAYEQGAQDADKKIRFLPSILIASIGITMTFLICQGLLINDRNQNRQLAIQQSSKAAHIIGLEMKNDILALLRMQSRLNTSTQDDNNAWIRDAQNYVRDNPAYMTLALMDKNFQIYEHVSTTLNSNIWKDLIFKRADLEKARTKTDLTVLKITTHSQNQAFIVFLLPLNTGDNFNGFLLAAYNIHEELSHLPMASSNPNAYFEIIDKEGTLYSNKQDHDFIWKFTHDDTINFYGLTWTIRETMNSSNSTNRSIVILILLAGIGFSISLANAKWQTEKIRIYSEDLQKSDDRYARTTSAAQVGLWDLDLSTNQITWAGNAWELFGAQSNADLWHEEQDVLNMISDEDRTAVRAEILDAISKNEGFNVDYRTRTMDNREIWVQSRGKVAGWKDGNPTCISGTLTDITKQKISETELKRTNHELERFAYVASHDLKAPLRNIDNLAKWVIEDTKDILPPDANDKLALLRGRVTRLEVLLDDILAYSRAGRITEKPSEIDTRQLVNSVAQSHVPSSFKVIISGELAILTSPRTPLEQIFGNILSNAVKHHDLKTGTIEVSAKETGSFYEFIVSDDGPGIPPEFHERVFDMFQTLQPRDKVDGSGMGMAIIKKLVEWGNGRVWIESNKGIRGTAIHFLWAKSV